MGGRAGAARRRVNVGPLGWLTADVCAGAAIAAPASHVGSEPWRMCGRGLGVRGGCAVCSVVGVVGDLVAERVGRRSTRWRARRREGDCE